MNTERSRKIAQDFLSKNQTLKRKVQIYQQVFHAQAADVFNQFCPTREADWIDGWTSDLVYTSTGYMEPECIFTTPETNVIGPGLWIVTRLEPYSLLDAVVVNNDVVEHFTINLADNKDGTCTGTWTLRFTALNQEGNQILDAMPENDPMFYKILEGLDHFMQTGELMRLQTV